MVEHNLLLSALQINSQGNEPWCWDIPGTMSGGSVL
jgi:hypothetical protein